MASPQNVTKRWQQLNNFDSWRQCGTFWLPQFSSTSEVFRSLTRQQPAVTKVWAPHLCQPKSEMETGGNASKVILGKFRHTGWSASFYRLWAEQNLQTSYWTPLKIESWPSSPSVHANKTMLQLPILVHSIVMGLGHSTALGLVKKTLYWAQHRRDEDFKIERKKLIKKSINLNLP